MGRLFLDAGLSADRTTIYIDADCYLRGNYANRRRFTLAEEAGHWFLHEDLYAAADFADLEDFVEFHRSFTERELAIFEWQAKAFAGLLLVPASDLKRRVEHEIDRLRARGDGSAGHARS